MDEHAHDEGTPHEHLSKQMVTFAQQFRPQPVPMGWIADLVPMMDGSDRLQLTLASVNGQWIGYFDRDGAITLGKRLIELAYMPPVKVEEPEGRVVLDGAEA